MIASVIENAVCSERDGNGNLYAATIQDSIPTFAKMDCINYLLHGSWYLEKLKVPEVSKPQLFLRFSLGQWVVQERPGCFFFSICGGIKIEQTCIKRTWRTFGCRCNSECRVNS